MMILSRMWYVILGILLAAAYYVVSLAVGQYNRRNAVAMEEMVKSDSQVVAWTMQLDARRRLDNLYLTASDTGIVKALRGAAGKEAVPAASKEEGARIMRALNEKLPAEYKNDTIFLADRDGKLVAQVGYDQVAAFPEFELGGYAAVYDALHGFLRDDTWVWGGRIGRVVARPVEDEVGQPPLGAVIAIRWVDKGFAKEIGKRTRTNVAFFALGQNVASAATTEGFEEQTLEALGADLKAVGDDKQFREIGRTDVRPLGADNKGGVLFARLPGDGWELGAGFAVARQKVAIKGARGFIEEADDQDKGNVKLWVVALLVLGAGGFGILFSFLEHTMPLGEMHRQSERLKKGEADVLVLPRFRGAYRKIAADINAGIQRVVEKGGGAARKPADLESILGPVPAQPNMSAFSFPMEGSAPPRNAANGSVQSSDRYPNAGPVVTMPPGRPNPPQAPPPPRVGPPPPAAGVPSIAPHAGPGPTAAFPGKDRPMPPIQGSAAPSPLASGAPPPPSSRQLNSLAPGNIGALKGATPMAPGNVVAPKLQEKEEDEQTMVGQPSADLIAATSGFPPAQSDVPSEWHQVYEEFLRTKRECNEPTDGLTFEKFQQTLKKNRDALMQRHGCKRVKFSVYVKEGRASLKATPVRE